MFIFSAQAPYSSHLDWASCSQGYCLGGLSHIACRFSFLTVGGRLRLMMAAMINYQRNQYLTHKQVFGFLCLCIASCLTYYTLRVYLCGVFCLYPSSAAAAGGGLLFEVPSCLPTLLLCF